MSIKKCHCEGTIDVFACSGALSLAAEGLAHDYWHQVYFELCDSLWLQNVQATTHIKSVTLL